MCLFSFFFFFLLFLLLYIYMFLFSGAFKSDFLLASIASRFLVAFLLKNMFQQSRGDYTFEASFPLFSCFSFLTLIFPFLVFLENRAPSEALVF